MVASRRKAPGSRRITLRHAWLAGLGVAAVAQREAHALAQRLLGALGQPARSIALSAPREVVALKVTPARKRSRAGLAAARRPDQSR